MLTAAHDGRPGLAADLAPGSFAVAGIAQGDLAAPQARAVPVALRVAAGTPMLEAKIPCPPPVTHRSPLTRRPIIYGWQPLPIWAGSTAAPMNTLSLTCLVSQLVF